MGGGFRQLGMFGLVEMAVFIALVFVAYVYVWRKGGLDWRGVDGRPPADVARYRVAVDESTEVAGAR